MNFSADDVATSPPAGTDRRASRLRQWRTVVKVSAAACLSISLLAGTTAAAQQPLSSDLSALRRPLETIGRAEAREEAVLAEVRRGVERLARTCTTTRTAPAASAGNASRDAVLQQYQREAAEARVRLSEKLNRVAEQSRAAAAARCTGFGAFLAGARTPECRSAESLRDATASAQKALANYFGAVEARYRLYGEVRDLEDRSCARPGFTQRLMQAEDASMRPQEAAASAAFEEFTRAAEDAAAALR